MGEGSVVFAGFYSVVGHIYLLASEMTHLIIDAAAWDVYISNGRVGTSRFSRSTPV